jgi:hypothetical protein
MPFADFFNRPIRVSLGSQEDDEIIRRSHDHTNPPSNKSPEMLSKLNVSHYRLRKEFL